MFGRSGVRLTSIIIGIVFILGLIVAANRFSTQLKQKIKASQPDKNVAIQPQISVAPEAGSQTSISPNPEVTTIPETGVNVFYVSMLLVLIAAGVLLRKKSLNQN